MGVEHLEIFGVRESSAYHTKRCDKCPSTLGRRKHPLIRFFYYLNSYSSEVYTLKISDLSNGWKDAKMPFDQHVHVSDL